MLVFLLGFLLGICLSLLAAGLLTVAAHRGWIKPLWRGF